jgi:hypothetical protein
MIRFLKDLQTLIGIFQIGCSTGKPRKKQKQAELQ